jgi:hypothetical protein
VISFLKLATCTQLGAPRSGIHVDFNVIGNYGTLSQNFDDVAGATSTKIGPAAEITLAVAGKSPQFLFHNPVFQGMKADDDEASVGL